MLRYTVYLYVNCSTCFGWYLHPSSRAHTTLYTASGTCQTGTATCRYQGKVGTYIHVEVQSLHDSQCSWTPQTFASKFVLISASNCLVWWTLFECLFSLHNTFWDIHGKEAKTFHPNSVRNLRVYWNKHPKRCNFTQWKSWNCVPTLPLCKVASFSMFIAINS